MLLTGALGLRCGEALALRREDLCLEGAIPKVTITGETPGARKSPGDVYVRKQHLHLLRDILKNGVSGKRTRGHKHGKGRAKVINFITKWKVPTTGYIFGARKSAQKGHLHYNAVHAHVRREAPKFAKSLKDTGKPAPPEIVRLRPHSGRATLITELMGEGMTTAMSMKYARHAPDSYKVHLKYGRLTLDNVKAACDALQSSRKKTQWSSMTTKELLSAQKAINKELQVRLQK
jgi:integrase